MNEPIDRLITEMILSDMKNTNYIDDYTKKQKLNAVNWVDMKDISILKLIKREIENYEYKALMCWINGDE